MTNTKTTPTANELKALEATLNYDDRDSQLSDNYCVAGMDELMAYLGWNKHQVSGLISSLEDKGLAFWNREYGVLDLTDDGVNAVFDHIEARND